MFYAVDSKGNDITPDDMSEFTPYICKRCKQIVIPKRGDIRAHHFAHKSSDNNVVRECDRVQKEFDNGMSEWHREWQTLFPDGEKEKWFEMKHRADVYLPKEDIVIEFQHSDLTPKMFIERSMFYTKRGIKIIWLFDLRDYYNDGTLRIIGDDELSEDEKSFLKSYPSYRNFICYKFDDLFADYNPSKYGNVTLSFFYEEEGRENYALIRRYYVDDRHIGAKLFDNKEDLIAAYRNEYFVPAKQMNYYFYNYNDGLENLIDDKKIMSSSDFDAWFDFKYDSEDDYSLDDLKYPGIRRNLKEKLSKEYVYLVFKKKMIEELDNMSDDEIMKIDEYGFIHCLIPEYDGLNMSLKDRLLDAFKDYLSKIKRRIIAEAYNRRRYEERQKLEEIKKKEAEERKRIFEEKQKHTERVEQKLEEARKKIRIALQRKTIDKFVFFESDYTEIIDKILDDDEYKSDEDLYKGCVDIIEYRREWLRNIEWEKEYTGGLSHHDAKINKEKMIRRPMVSYYINDHRYFICIKCKRLIIENYISYLDDRIPTRGICIQCKER